MGVEVSGDPGGSAGFEEDGPFLVLERFGAMVDQAIDCRVLTGCPIMGFGLGFACFLLFHPNQPFQVFRSFNRGKRYELPSTKNNRANANEFGTDFGQCVQ
jgi:hypothetical protein